MQAESATCTVRYMVSVWGIAKKNSSGISFFSFPRGKSAAQQRRRKAWDEFCKRKEFNASSSIKICSRYFKEDTYEPGHSPQFLQCIECKETFRPRLKSDDLPALNKSGTWGHSKGCSTKAKKIIWKRFRSRVNEQIDEAEAEKIDYSEAEQIDEAKAEQIDEPDPRPSTSATYKIPSNYRNRSTQTRWRQGTRTVSTQTVVAFPNTTVVGMSVFVWLIGCFALILSLNCLWRELTFAVQQHVACPIAVKEQKNTNKRSNKQTNKQTNEKTPQNMKNFLIDIHKSFHFFHWLKNTTRISRFRNQELRYQNSKDI